MLYRQLICLLFLGLPGVLNAAEPTLGMRLLPADEPLSTPAPHGREVLFLKNGDRLTGVSRGLVDGQMEFELPHGVILPIPLTDIDRLEYLPAESADAAAGLAGEQPLSEQAIMVGPGDLPLASELDDGVESARWGQRLSRALRARLDDWTKRVGLGFRFVDGNAKETNVDLSALFEQRKQDRFTQITLGGQYGSSNGIRGTNRWFANSTTDMNLHESWIWFLNLADEYNERQNLDYRGSFSTGPGYRFFDEEKKRLIIRFGPAVTYEIFHEPANSRTSPDWFSELEMKWPLTEAMQLEHRTSVNASVNDISFVRSTSNSGLLWALDSEKRWNLRLGFQYQYVSRPNEGRGPNDYWTTLQIVYQRK